MHRTVEVTDGHQRLNAVFVTRPEHLLIEPQSRLVWLLFLPSGKYPRPCNAHAVDFKAHLAEEAYVLPEMVKHINGLVRGIPVLPVADKRYVLSPYHCFTVRSCRTHVHIGESSSVLLPAALALVCRSGASPEEIFTQSHFPISFPVI